MSIEEVLISVRKKHGDSYQLVGRLEGGYQGGAYLITRNGKQAVLKWSENLSWATQVLRAAPVVQKIREHGYPTPAWLAVGVTDQGFPYQVQEFVDGSPLSVLDDSAADLLLGVVDRQAKLNPDPGRDWSDYASGVVFGEGRSHLMASGEAGAAVVDAFDRLCRPLHDLPLPGEDMVHGDLGLENVMVSGGRVSGVVDIEAVGSGSRVFDLAAVIRSAYIWGAEPAALERIRQAAENIAGPDVLRLFAAATVYDILNFGLQHWDGGIVRAAPAALRLAADL